MKIRFLISLMICLLLAAGVCGAEEIAATVNGRPVTEEALQERLQTSQIVNTYATAEMTQEEKDEIARVAREAALQVLIREEALLDEAEKRGFGSDSPEVRAEADSLYEQMIASAEAYVLASYPNLSGEELAVQVDTLLGIAGGSRENYKALALRSAALSALDAALMEELQNPSEAEIQAYYDTLYAEQKAQFDMDHNSFEAAMLQEKLVVYRPVDLKMIQKAEFLFEQEALALIRQTAAINVDMADEMRADQHRLLLPSVEKVHQELINGSRSFAEVLEGLKPGSSQKYNYFNEASSRFNDDYYSRAAAFENVGEISTIYEMTTGFAILYYAGDVPDCEKVPLEEVREQICSIIVSENSAEALQTAKDQIVAAAEIVIQ